MQIKRQLRADQLKIKKQIKIVFTGCQIKID